MAGEQHKPELGAAGKRRERGRREEHGVERTGGLADQGAEGVDARGVYITFQFGSVRPSCGEEHSAGSSGQYASPSEMGKRKLANFPASLGEKRRVSLERRAENSAKKDTFSLSLSLSLFLCTEISTLLSSFSYFSSSLSFFVSFRFSSSLSLSLSARQTTIETRESCRSRFTVPGRSQQERSLCFNFDY